MDKVNEKASVYDYARMCKSFEHDCRGCPLFTPNDGQFCRQIVEVNPDKANEIILNWCKEHPIETRQDKFLNMFPKAPKDENGTIAIAPCTVEKDYKSDNCSRNHCKQCRKYYWLAEVDEK